MTKTEGTVRLRRAKIGALTEAGLKMVDGYLVVGASNLGVYRKTPKDMWCIIHVPSRLRLLYSRSLTQAREVLGELLHSGIDWAQPARILRDNRAAYELVMKLRHDRYKTDTREE